eukprot:CAMPEP_0197570530 /NCGR_PEP_ID=MMETSP1320-20131121/40855_1 /TAXON_ID=91990 /ORGANISM="Bolidomonas sp., Strain RCC2347" /LENGTH=418 /DNA_ID=CAMNT_0043132965 /DNA_START=25 /DNA_END=1278 /DNA_ORIENTATION=-
MTDKVYKIGMIGGGVVGGGVLTILHSLSSTLPLTVPKMVVRDPSKPRSFAVPSTTSVSGSIDDVLDDASIDIVVEVMGGTGAALDVVKRALASGKHVVTANKALLAEHLEEVLAAGGRGTSLGYEAAVCGGIPIINALQTAYAGDKVTKVQGIMNGTTNYMLCKMEKGAEYADVLKEAQALGYAEADPTADVEGHDVRAKLAILSKLAFGTTTPITSIPTTGITSITPVDFSYAASMGSTIRLIGTAHRTNLHAENDGPVALSVCPCVVPLGHPASSVTGAGNLVVVSSDNLGSASYAGPGAGRFPTANSVVADVVRIVSGSQPDAFPSRGRQSADVGADTEGRFYVRVQARDSIGIIKSLGSSAEGAGVSIHSVLQGPISSRDEMDFVVVTEACGGREVRAMVDGLIQGGKVKGCPV